MGPMIVCVLLCIATSVSCQKNDVPLKVTTILEDPFLRIKNTRENETLSGNARFEGFIVSLLEEISQYTGMKFELILAPDARYGIELNGSWVGMVGELINRKADIAAAALTITPARMRVIDFTVPFMDSGPVILMRKPPRDEHISIFDRLLGLLIPFDNMVWLMMLIAYIVTGFFLYLVSYFNPYEWRKMAIDGLATIRERESFTCLNTYWYLLSTFMWQGYIRAPRSLGGRIISGFWWLFVVFSLISYTASLTNYLKAVQNSNTFPTPIRSFEDLAFSTNYKIGIINGGSTKEYLESSELPVFKRIWNRIQSHGDLLLSTSEGIDLLNRQYSYAFIAESASAQIRSSAAPCNLIYTQPTDSPYFQAIGVPKDSPHRNQLNAALLSIQTSGKLRMIREAWLSRNECTGHAMIPLSPERRMADKFYFLSLDLVSFSGVLVLLGIGIVAGCLLTAIEICLFKIAEKSTENEVSEDGVVASKGAGKIESDV